MLSGLRGKAFQRVLKGLDAQGGALTPPVAAIGARRSIFGAFGGLRPTTTTTTTNNNNNNNNTRRRCHCLWRRSQATTPPSEVPVWYDDPLRRLPKGSRANPTIPKSSCMPQSYMSFNPQAWYTSTLDHFLNPSPSQSNASTLTPQSYP